jgi:hypothetical protein
MTEEPTAPLPLPEPELPNPSEGLKTGRPTPTLPDPNVGIKTGKPVRNYPVRGYTSHRYIDHRTSNGLLVHEYDLLDIGVHVGLFLVGLLLGWLIFAPHTLVFSFR